jgi:SPP1 gp7 family putative phage head morphogenesis protein
MLAEARRDKVAALGPWHGVRSAEKGYARSLRIIARHCYEMIRDVPPHQAVDMLYRYAEVIRPWVELTAGQMVADVLRRDLTAWMRKSRELDRPLGAQARVIATGDVTKELVAQQMAAIISLPTDAAQRLADGRSPDEVSGWLHSKANVISRNQVAQAATAVVRLRAYHLGSEGYIWRTAQDSRVRPRHRVLEGKFFRWVDPPVVDEKGMRGHPGHASGCRCIPEPVVGEYR